MLQMRCPECNGIISSPLLAEIPSIECGQCKAYVKVNDVFVTTKSFIVRRTDLLNRIFRYRKLLDEIDKERSLLRKDKNTSNATLRSLDHFYASLQELLAGARSSLRMKMDLPVEFEYQNNKGMGKIINLSTDGALIKLGKVYNEPKNIINLLFTIPNSDNSISVKGKIVWHKEANIVEENWIVAGIKFVNVEEEIKNAIFNLIVKEVLASDEKMNDNFGNANFTTGGEPEINNPERVREMEQELNQLKRMYQEVTLENSSLKAMFRGKA